MPVPARPLKIDDAVDELLASVDTGDCGPEVATALRRMAEQLLRRVRLTSPGLTSQQRAYLIQSDAFSPRALAETEESVARGDLRELEHRTSLDVIAASYGESQVAERLTISGTDVRSGHADGELYAFDAAGIAALPRRARECVSRDSRDRAGHSRGGSATGGGAPPDR